MESSVPRHLAGCEIHGFYTLEELDIGKIKEEAAARWLRSNEIYAMLRNYMHFNINVKPLNLPGSGTLVLYDRRKLRDFRKDGHNWKKKNDGKTVKEAHEHLKIGNEERIHVYYAHGEENSYFVRRLYWLLDRQHEHIVLVHYRETLEEVDLPHSAWKECREALSLSVRSNLHPISPLTPVNCSSGSGSGYSDKTGSIVAYEEIDCGTNLSTYTEAGTSSNGQSMERSNELCGNADVRNHELTLHEINTLEWEDLLHDSVGFVEPRKEETLCLEQQMRYKFKDSKSNDLIQIALLDLSSGGEIFPSQGSTKELSSLGLPTGSGTTTGSKDYKQVSIAYSHSVGHQNIQPISSGMVNTGVESQDIEIFPTDTVEKSEISVEESFRTQDYFGRWLNYGITVSSSPLDDLQLDHSTSNSHGSSASVIMEQPSLPQQIFTITEVSPSWAFATEETKVIVTGYFHEAHLAECNLYCSFGEIFLPMERVQDGVFRFMAPPHTSGLVNLYLTFDGHTPISQILSFECRSFPCISVPLNNVLSPPKPDKFKRKDFENQMRLAQLLFSTTNSTTVLTDKVSSNNLNEAKRFLSLAPRHDKEWKSLMKLMENNQIPFSQVHHSLVELIFKCKLQEWLLEKVIKGCKVTDYDHKGQGVIHLCAILGYPWAVYSIKLSRLSLDFRDAFGWRALHWAAYYGKEHMAAVLLSAGANPSLVSDPTHEFPGGCTAADLASKKGYDGLAAYLAESSLIAHFKAITISRNLNVPLSPRSNEFVKPENLTEEQLALKDSLAAIRNAADAASRIQNAFREHSLNLRLKAAQSSVMEAEARDIIAAFKIQNAFRRHCKKKQMVAAVWIQHRFHTWKMQKHFVKIRRQAIKIQAAYRGHLMRKQYQKILWSVGVLEKAILRWRLRRKGLRGIQVEPTAEPDEAEKGEEDTGEEDFFKISRRHAEERVERSVIRVQAIFRSHQAQAEYRRMKLCHDQAKLDYGGLRKA